MTSALYFSYGSNMDKESMKSRCPDAELIGKGFLDNHTLAFTSHLSQRKRSGADIIFKKGEKIWGLVYKISDKDLQLLDENKIYPSIYSRKQVKIYLNENQPDRFLDNVWIYEINDKSLLTNKINKDYIHLLIKASEQNNFPEEFISGLKNYLSEV